MKGQWESHINGWLPFMYSQNWNCYFQNRIIMFCLPVPTLIYLWEIYIFPRSVCLFCCRKYVDWSWEYINGSQTHECGDLDWGRAIPRKGIQKWNFPCSVLEQTTFASFHHKKRMVPCPLLLLWWGRRQSGQTSSLQPLWCISSSIADELEHTCWRWLGTHKRMGNISQRRHIGVCSVDINPLWE